MEIRVCGCDTPTQSISQLEGEIEWLEALVAITVWKLKQNLAYYEFSKCSIRWIKVVEFVLFFPEQTLIIISGEVEN